MRDTCVSVRRGTTWGGFRVHSFKGDGDVICISGVMVGVHLPLVSFVQIISSVTAGALEHTS